MVKLAIIRPLAANYVFTFKLLDIVFNSIESSKSQLKAIAL